MGLLKPTRDDPVGAVADNLNPRLVIGVRQSRLSGVAANLDHVALGGGKGAAGVAAQDEHTPGVAACRRELNGGGAAVLRNDNVVAAGHNNRSRTVVAHNRRIDRARNAGGPSQRSTRLVDRSNHVGVLFSQK